jgi:hypothetical protein
MVAAQRFNLARENVINVIYGSVTSGNRWIFLQLKEQTLTIDLEEYVVLPIDWLLNALVWMCSQI